MFSSDYLNKITYQAIQQSYLSFSLAHKNINTQLRNFFAPAAKPNTQTLSPETLQQLQIRLTKLLEVDWEDARLGIYPQSLLFERPWQDFFFYYPFLWLDMPSIWERITKKQYQQFSPEIDLDGYPQYYLQNFHYQTNGYLSHMSANLYDLQVEILFNGMGGAMGRRILAPLKQGLEGLKRESGEKMRVLDVACGTGVTLKLIRAAIASASLFGIDLSPTYLRKANDMLAANYEELPQLLQANAEELPYRDNYFHGVTCVFLFHELPPVVRGKAIAEMFRVMKPGGVLVICDSIQRRDSPELLTMMDNFPAIFHEPYYQSYINDDLEQRLYDAGFEQIRTENHFVSKYWVARKKG